MAAEVIAGKALIDYGDRRFIGLVLSVEKTALQQSHADCLEEARAGGNHSDIVVLSGGCLMSFHLDTA